jgi:hypothetical protein
VALTHRPRVAADIHKATVEAKITEQQGRAKLAPQAEDKDGGWGRRLVDQIEAGMA